MQHHVTYKLQVAFAFCLLLAGALILNLVGTFSAYVVQKDERVYFIYFSS